MAEPAPRLVGEPAERAALVERITAALTAASPGSTVEPRGSLAAGTADAYSDIDLAWVVPDERFGAAVASVVTALAPIAPVISLRSDPDIQRSDRRRLLFARFAGVPLFWRLDLEIWAASVASDPTVDAELTDWGLTGADWCPHESALMNALGAVKALLRGHDQLAHDGLTRGLERVGAAHRLDLPDRDRVIALAEYVAADRPHLAGLTGDVTTAARSLLTG